MKKCRSSIILWLVFETIAIWLWQATGNLFFLLNFSYIGFCIGFGGILFAAGWKYAREFTQFGVGTYMLVSLRVHPLSEVHEGLSDKGFVSLNYKTGLSLK